MSKGKLSIVMAKRVNEVTAFNPLELLVQQSFLFGGFEPAWLKQHIDPDTLAYEKLYSNRPIYTAFRPDASIDFLYVIVSGGPVVVRSTPLDRIIAMTFPRGCFGMRNLPISFGNVARSFPSLVEAYKTTDVIKVPSEAIETLYRISPEFQTRYGLLFELREKFQYHLLNCSAYPPQAVAALLRALIYQERALGSQPQEGDVYKLDLPIDLIARACQLNHRTVEQVLKGMTQAGFLKSGKHTDTSADIVQIVDAEGLKEVYGATRDKVSWWPLK